MLNENFVYVGVVIGIIGGLSYFIDTIRGKVKPNRVSFLLWSLAPLIAFIAQLKEGVGIQSLLTFSVGFVPAIIFLGSFVNKKALWKITPFDLICGAFSLLGLLLWLITKEGVVAIVFSIIADGMAGIPTIVKSYRYPETESSWAYLAASINSLFTLLTITQWNFAAYGFPLYVLMLTLGIFVLVQFKIGKARPAVGRTS